jgi:DNA-binding helix-hairpin-helix protein with protein kinase domain
MAQFFDSHGRPVVLGRQLGSGGEGAVFEVGGATGFVAKVYHKPVNAEKSEKLRCMVTVGSPQVMKYAAWPVSTMHATRGGQVVGIILPSVKGYQEIHNLYSPAHRKLKYPDRDWSFLLHVAMNCAAAFDAIHNGSHVIGDVNQGNVMVAPDGTVSLIDCDSYQIVANGKHFLCEVGVPQFTPPELQGRNFRGVQRNANHDRFGLAVLIFHLLLMGRHPYAGRFAGRGDMPIEKAIKEFRFAFSQSAASLQMARPPMTLPLQEVTPQLSLLFERAFCAGSERSNARPGAGEWYAALYAMRSQLRVCGSDRGHRFPAQVGDCPWCKIIRDGGPNFFVSVTVRTSPTGVVDVTIDITTLWRNIETIPGPKNTCVRPLGQVPCQLTPCPLPPGVDASEGLTSLVRQVALGSFALVVASFILPLLAYFSVPAALTFGVWWAILAATSPLHHEKSLRRGILRARSSELADANTEWQQTIDRYETEFRSHLQKLARVRDEASRLRKAYDDEIRNLERSGKDRQLSQYLQNIFISDHKIARIGSARLAVLESFGIETAYDIEATQILQIPGFGEALTSTLVQWRRHMESQFRFDPRQGVSPSERQAVAVKFSQLKQHLESTLRRGPDELRQIAIQAHNASAQIADRVNKLHKAVAQAKVDLAMMDSM